MLALRSKRNGTSIASLVGIGLGVAAVAAARPCAGQTEPNTGPQHHGNNRLYLDIGYFAGVEDAVHTQADQSSAGGGPGLHIGYARRLLDGLELGIDGMAASSSSGGVSTVMLPSLLIRPYIPLDSSEIGIVLPRIGWGVLSGPAGRWSGPGVAGGFDYRYWFSPGAAIHVSLEAQYNAGRGSGGWSATWAGAGSCVGVVLGW